MVRLALGRSEDHPQEDLSEPDGADPEAVTGWQQPIHEWKPARDVFALICDRNFPADDATRLLQEVVLVRPSALWVVRETDRRARSLLSENGIEPVLAPLVGYWKWVQPDGEVYDNRARLRDEEIARLCEIVLVARDRSSAASNWWLERSKLFEHIRIATR